MIKFNAKISKRTNERFDDPFDLGVRNERVDWLIEFADREGMVYDTEFKHVRGKGREIML